MNLGPLRYQFSCSLWRMAASRTSAAEMLDEFLLVVHVGRDHVHRGEQNQLLGHFAAMGKHTNLETARGELADELGTDETGAAEDADALNLHIDVRLGI